MPAIAQDGHFDDDSFYLTYGSGSGASNGWTPSYAVPAAYNHTLHATKVVENQLEFPFTGTVASLNMLGTSFPNTSTKLKVQFNVDLAGNMAPKTYAEAQAYYAGLTPPSTLTCVNILNNQPPTSDVNSTISELQRCLGSL